MAGRGQRFELARLDLHRLLRLAETEHHGSPGQLHHVIAAQTVVRQLVQGFPDDTGAVGAAQVAQHEAALLIADLSVRPGHERAIEGDLVVPGLTSPDKDRIVVQTESLAGWVK